MQGVADAVFLDLPAPDKAVVHALRAIKPSGGRLACFSPCIEQVQATCNELRQRSCVDIRTFEVLERQPESRTVKIPVMDLELNPHRGSASVEGEAASSADRPSKRAKRDTDGDS